MYALIRSGGKQYKIAQGELVRVGKLTAEVGATISFEEVLAVNTGDDFVVGSPLVASAKVTGTVVAHGRDRKINVFRFKRRKSYHKKIGHRQDFTEIRINEIAVS